MSEDTLQNEDLEEEVIETEEAVAEEVAESSDEETSEQSSEETTQSRNQNAKQRLKRKLRESEAEKSQLAQKLTALEQKVESVINPPPQRPSRVEFETEEDYEDALFDWRANPQSHAPAQHNVPPQPVSNQTVDYEIEDNWEAQIDKAEDKYNDFHEVVNNPNIPISGPMADAIKSADKGGEIAYFLGKNPAEADKIARMSPVMQIRAIDQLGNKFQSTTTTKAPDPIVPSKGGDVPMKDIDKMSMSEYAAYMNKKQWG